MVPPIPPSWEVLDQEASDLGMTVSYETDADTGQGYVSYSNSSFSGSYLDHPIGRMSAQEAFERLNSEREDNNAVS